MSFDVPALLTVLSSAGDMLTVESDLARLVLAVQEVDNGVWLPLRTTINADGTLSASVDQPGVYALLWTAAPPAAEPTPQAEAATGRP